MKLTRTERWLLCNQYHILELLLPDEAKHYANAREALGCGYELEYEELCQEIYKDDDALTTEECKEVVDIMAMFDALKRCYDALPDPKGIEKWRVAFGGFDGNNEGKQMSYARFYCTSGIPKFQDLDRGDDFNSHIPSLPRYKAMLLEWKKTPNKYSLTKDDILRIGSAN